VVNSDVQLKGTIFNPRKVEKIIGEEIEGMLDEASMFGETAVKSQLFPGHGLVTGYLRESVSGVRVDSLHAVIDAGEVTQGKNVVYASFIESLYNMFHNSWKLIQRKNLPKLLRTRIAGRLNGR